MRKFFNTLIFVPLALIFVAFAVANRQLITLSFDPFNTADPAIGLRLPLFLVIIVVAILGIFAGGFVTWWRQGVWRRRARERDVEARKLRAELDSLREANLAGRAPEAGASTPLPLMLPPAA